MGKNKKVTQDLLLRISRAEELISNWMYEKGIGEIDTEGYMPVLVNSGIYDYDSSSAGATV
jgi:hypothetical protein